jgi:hypothetical protein
VLNTPSHHRVHHGSNERYLDRNHGSILIVWDRLFGTFSREDPDEPVIYGLTRNIHTYNPVLVVTHEYLDMVRDVARSETWRDRISFVLRGPGWAYRRRAELADAASPVGRGRGLPRAGGRTNGVEPPRRRPGAPLPRRIRTDSACRPARA